MASKLNDPSQARPQIFSEDPQLDSLRKLLLSEDRQRIERLSQETDALSTEARENVASLQQQIEALKDNLAQMQHSAIVQQERADALEVALKRLQEEMRAESENLEPRLIAQMGRLISATIRNAREEMAEALGPIMGEAIRVQIRDSRQSMIAAFSPIILETVQRAVADLFREFQRNLDGRLRSTIRPRSWSRTLTARLRGISPSELALRDALPFIIQEIFVIQYDSGLLLSHWSFTEKQSGDSGLISGMLTAIRNFAQDSFGAGEDELDEIQYGDESIIIQGGEHIYLAVVVEGIEPVGFRARLWEFVSDLHVHYGPQLRDYIGDPETQPPLEHALAEFAADITGGPKVAQRSRSRKQWLLIFSIGLIVIVLLGLALFYLLAPRSLWPMALPPLLKGQT